MVYNEVAHVNALIHDLAHVMYVDLQCVSETAFRKVRKKKITFILNDTLFKKMRDDKLYVFGECKISYSGVSRRGHSTFLNALRKHIGNPFRPFVVVFDLDNTLVHSCESFVETEHASFRVRAGGETFSTHVRPYVHDFVDLLARNGIEYAVWTAAVREYADGVVKGINKTFTFRPKFVWSRSSTIMVDENYVKDMRNIRGGILLDDSMHHKLYPGNKNRVELVPRFVSSSIKEDTFFRDLTEASTEILRTRVR